SMEYYGDLAVVYTKEAETADMYIEKVTRELGKRHRVRVATSDGLEQIIILSHGALRVPASEFHDEVIAAEKAIREILE
ncbi:MAG: NYN domain-containing protein, partial [Clostridia bacterium]|nr:NYN domain-containing protein [Clostridia bacterium]